jgi:diphosphomevalonate decarboxylase
MIVEAIAHPNIAVVKYWGKRNVELNLPAVPSLSLTLSNFHTRTKVEWGSSRDKFILNGKELQDIQAKKVFTFLDKIEENRSYCAVTSENNFPTAAGLASSSSAFSALAIAALQAKGIDYSPEQASVLARQGSGSACRSIWGGWVEWKLGSNSDGKDSHGVPIAPKEHWNIRLIVAVVSSQKKSISSTKGMLRCSNTSPMYASWVETADNDVTHAKQAILNKDIEALGTTMEHSTLKMYSTMFTSKPAIRFWKPNSVAIMQEVEHLRNKNIPCWFTMDAGPNVKILCPPEYTNRIVDTIKKFTSSIHVLEAGDDARIV